MEQKSLCADAVDQRSGDDKRQSDADAHIAGCRQIQRHTL